MLFDCFYFCVFIDEATNIFVSYPKLLSSYLKKDLSKNIRFGLNQEKIENHGETSRFESFI